MPLQGATSDVQSRNDHVVDSGCFEQAGKIFGAVIGKTVSDGQDPECVGVGWKWIVGWLSLESCGHKDSGCNAKDSFHGV